MTEFDQKLNTTEEADRRHMREQIKQRPVNKRRLARRSMITAFLAVVFGGVACLVFLLLRPVIENKLYPPQEPAPITFPEEPVQDEMSPEDMVAEEKDLIRSDVEEEVTASLDTDKIREEVLEQVQQQAEQQVREQAEQQVREQAEQQVREQAEQQVREQAEAAIQERDVAGDYIAQYVALSEIAAEASGALVTVTSITPDYDWVGDLYLDSGRATGVIVAETEGSVLILTEGRGLTEADSIRLTFADDSQCYARVRAVDEITQMAVLEASKEDMGALPGEDSEIRIAALGSSARTTLLGRPIIAIGAPTGVQGSVSYGVVTNSSQPLDVTDSNYKLITTDIYGSTQASGVLIDTSAEIIGWISMRYNKDDSANLISAVGITELKPLIEKLSNAAPCGYLGIHGTDVPALVNEEEGVPFGAYVTKVEMDSPAMECGLQSGDVITQFDGEDIMFFRELAAGLRDAAQKETVQLTVMRLGYAGYEPAQLECHPGSRILVGE